MKIFVTGGTGFIGRQLIERLLQEGHEVSVLTRSAAKAEKIFEGKVIVIEGDPLKPGDWQEEIGKNNAVINLCGEPILDKKWTSERKKLILESRLLPTQNIIDGINSADKKPEVLISGSAIGYYSNRGDEVITEDAAPGDDFGAELCSRWEDVANKAKDLGVRVVSIRTGFVLAKKGGGLAKMIPPFKFFAGGPIGNGKQFMSWIHINDHIGITITVLKNKEISGPVNLTAPNPVTNKEFSKTLGKVLGRPSWLPVPAFALKLMFGEGAALLTEGQRVIPKKALDAGYKFQFENLKDALSDVLN